MSGQNQRERRLLTIMSADVAGYSHHMEVNEEATIAGLLGLMKAAEAIIRSRGGSVANTAGDGLIAWFPSASDAVNAATSIQATLKEIPQVGGAGPLSLRIGINLGEVYPQPDGDLLGDGVNIAARLQALALPGGICIADNVFSLVDGRVDLGMRKMGEFALKNIERPISVYAVGEYASTTKSRLLGTLRNVLRRYRSLAITAVAILAFGIGLTSWLIIHRSEAPVVLKQEPPSGTLGTGNVVFVDDGQCGPGLIKRVVGGDNQAGTPRRHTCIPR